NYIGLFIENKISLGFISLHLIFNEDATELKKALKSQGYGLTMMTAEGNKGDVKLLEIIVKRKNKQEVMEIIKKFNPNSFISIQQVKSASGGDFPENQKTKWNLLKRVKKK
ncbi:MAG: DUF2179 domain-containing protein, partial [Candidatus Lokiarchaeota archaeon]|nr:DUF2179 domain-containing protein [Candidatus Lokiarchaeota archaeon]